MSHSSTSEQSSKVERASAAPSGLAPNYNAAQLRVMIQDVLGSDYSTSRDSGVLRGERDGLSVSESFTSLSTLARKS